MIHWIRKINESEQKKKLLILISKLNINKFILQTIILPPKSFHSIPFIILRFTLFMCIKEGWMLQWFGNNMKDNFCNLCSCNGLYIVAPYEFQFFPKFYCDIPTKGHIFSQYEKYKSLSTYMVQGNNLGLQLWVLLKIGGDFSIRLCPAIAIWNNLVSTWHWETVKQKCP